MDLRVATYNLYLGADLSLLFGVPPGGQDAVVAGLLAQLERTDFPTRAGVVARLLVEEDVDVVGLQEVTTWSRDGAAVVDFLSELRRALAALGADYDVRAVNPNFGGSAYGLDVRGRNVTLVRAGLATGSQRTGTFAAGLVVPLPSGDLRIDRSWGSVAVEGLTFVNTHTEAYDPLVRDAQRDELLVLLSQVPDPVVLVGDFNATPGAVGMPAAWTDAWEAAGAGNGFTCGQDADLGNARSLLRERIDYIWVRGASVSHARLVGHREGDRTPTGLWPSDHAGVVARVHVDG